MIFQDPTTTLNPVLPVGRQVTEGQVAHGQIPKRMARAAGDRTAARGRYRRSRRARASVPAPVLGRHAPARRDRDGDGGPPQADHRRRADDRARRHGAGAGAVAARRAPGRDRRRGHADHPRSRRDRRGRAPGGRDVWRPHRGNRAGRRHLRAAAPSLHGRIAAEHPAHRQRRASGSVPIPGQPPTPSAPAVRLQLPSALPDRARTAALCRGGPRRCSPPAARICRRATMPTRSRPCSRRHARPSRRPRSRNRRALRRCAAARRRSPAGVLSRSGPACCAAGSGGCGRWMA